MKRSERMNIVRSVAEHEERQESRGMGEAQRMLEDQYARLEELKAYRYEYAAGRKLKNGLHASHWQDYHRFLKRLDEAVVAQEQAVRDGKARRAVHRQRWMMKRQRLESLSRVVDRYTAEESREMERQFRKLQDSLPIRPGPYQRDD